MTEYGMANIRNVYRKAADGLAGRILEAERKGLSEITVQSWTKIQHDLEAAAVDIKAAIDDGTNRVVTLGARRFSKIHEDYMISVAGQTGGRITAAGIQSMVVGVDRRVVASIVNRVYQDGYTYSMRLWRAAGAYGQNMKNLISAGLAQGRDLFEIADDVKIYAARGRSAVVKRYGDLLPGTREFIRRVGNTVDYNALRILRSELYASMQDAARLQGQMNPGCNGWYEWIRGGTTDWSCECPDYAAGSPYTLEKLPSYPHSQCLCRVQPMLMDRREFVDDLRRWGAGERVEYLDKWYQEQYLPYAA